MSENGPYNQPPQNPYGGGDGTGGQPPYGQPHGGPYGDPGTGGQPGYGQAPYPGAPGQDQGMYAGGQPPYGAPVGPGGPMGPGGPVGPGGYPPAPPPQGGGSKAGLWVVIGGGVVIVVLVIAVVAMLVTNGNRGEEVAAGSGETTQEEPAEEEPAEEPAEEEPAEEPAANEGPSGEPPYALPAEPCDSFTEQVQSDFLLRDSGSKYVSDNTSSCSETAEVPEGNPDDAYGYLEIGYNLPYSASDSNEAAAQDFQETIDNITGEGYSDRYSADDIEENKAVEGLGDEAHLVVTKYEMLGNLVPEATLLVRADNLVVEVNYYLDDFNGDTEDLTLPEDIEGIMVNAATEAMNLVGT
ncbi:DUF3558 domain-containing protein [Nocardiopsis terrae]